MYLFAVGVETLPYRQALLGSGRLYRCIFATEIDKSAHSVQIMEDHNTRTTDVIEGRSPTIKVEYGGSGCRRRKAKPKIATSRKERRRTQNINAAFEDLRKHIPNVPSDTKLSKIKTLKLAMSYIHHLEHQLEDETIDQETSGSTEETSIKTESPQRNSNNNVKPLEVQQSVEEKTRHTPPRRSSRTGWPQHVWALELMGSLKQQSVV